MYLHYATVIGDLQRVIEHWILEEEWSKTIDIINRQVSSNLFTSFTVIYRRIDGPGTLLPIRSRTYAPFAERDCRLMAATARAGPFEAHTCPLATSIHSS